MVGKWKLSWRTRYIALLRGWTCALKDCLEWLKSLFLVTQLKLLSFNVLTLEINAMYYMIKIYSAQTKKIIRQRHMLTNSCLFELKFNSLVNNILSYWAISQRQKKAPHPQSCLKWGMNQLPKANDGWANLQKFPQKRALPYLTNIWSDYIISQADWNWAVSIYHRDPFITVVEMSWLKYFLYFFIFF